MQRFSCVSLSLLVMALSLSGTAADPHCPFDWSFYNGHCYKVFKNLKSWNNAEMFCRQQEEGSHLASIQSWGEAAFVATVVSRDVLLLNVWIGLNDPWKQRTWVWSDGSSFRYRSWKRGEPNNFLWNEYCVELWSLSGFLKWNDERCGSLRFFICKFQPQALRMRTLSMHCSSASLMSDSGDSGGSKGLPDGPGPLSASDSEPSS